MGGTYKQTKDDNSFHFPGDFSVYSKIQHARLLQFHQKKKKRILTVNFERVLRDFSADSGHLEIMVSELTGGPNLDHLRSCGQRDQSSLPVLYILPHAK